MKTLAIFGLGVPEILVLLFFVGGFIFWLWAFVDILKSQFKGGSDKIVWLLVVLFIPFVGVILYFLIGRNQKVVD